ncbi:hypothetical protein ACWIGI_05745 [Nocardia sp. NPDC055321]
MRIGSSALVVLGAVAVLATAGCSDDSTSESAPATSAEASAQDSRPAAPLDPKLPVVDCGPGPLGLAVVAYTQKGTEFCGTALAVTTSYTDARKTQESGDIPVTIENVRWICGERQGDPNPFQECSSQNESADRIRLQS